MVSNEWVNLNGIWYRFDANGVMLANQWYKDVVGNWYWLKNNGDMASSELMKISEVWYRFTNTGVMSNKTNIKVARVNECDFLNIRSGPSTDYQIIDQVYTNEYVEVLEENNSSWEKVQLGNDTI